MLEEPYDWLTGYDNEVRPPRRVRVGLILVFVLVGLASASHDVLAACVAGAGGVAIVLAAGWSIQAALTMMFGRR